MKTEKRKSIAHARAHLTKPVSNNARTEDDHWKERKMNYKKFIKMICFFFFISKQRLSDECAVAKREV